MPDAVPGTTACDWCKAPMVQKSSRHRFCTIRCRQSAHDHTEAGRERHRRWHRTEGGKAYEQKRRHTPERLAARDRHEAVRGYTRKRLIQLREMRERAAAELDELRRSVA